MGGQRHIPNGYGRRPVNVNEEFSDEINGLFSSVS